MDDATKTRRDELEDSIARMAGFLVMGRGHWPRYSDAVRESRAALMRACVAYSKLPAEAVSEL